MEGKWETDYLTVAFVQSDYPFIEVKRFEDMHTLLRTQLHNVV